MRRLGGFVLVGAFALGCGFDTEGIGRGLDVEVDDDEDDDGSADDPNADPVATSQPPDDSAGTSATGTTTGADPSATAADEDSGDETAGVVEETTGASDDGTGAGEEGSTTDGGEGSTSGDAGEGSTSGDPTDSDAGSGDGGEDDSGNNACPASFTELLWADGADLSAPMGLLTDTSAMGDPDVATSEVADSGTVTFTVDVPCPGEYLVWGLVWDYWPGAYATDDPDSHYVAADGGSEVVWRYGCQTGEGDDGLSWQRFEALQAQPCDTVALVLDVQAAGEHTLSFRNREWGSGSVVAGVSALILTTDATLDPYAEYTPY